MKNQSTIDLFRYWNRLRGQRPAPLRAEIEPSDIRQHLADTFILERDARGQSVFRLAGTRVCALYGRELKNFSFPSLFGAHDLVMVQRLIKACYDDSNVCMIAFEGHSAGGRKNSFEAILLPLSGDNQSARLFGAIIPDTKPFWLGADPIAENAVLSVRIVDAHKEHVFLSNRPSVAVPPLAPASANLTGGDHLFHSGTAPAQPGSARRIRHLTLITGGRQQP